MTTMLVDVAAQVEALFASPLQPSQHPTVIVVRAAVVETWSHRGERGCAAVVAQEFGDHPDAAAARMCWCRLRVAEAYA